MSALLVFGAGGHGKVVADAARATGRWSTIVYADDRFPAHARWFGLEVIGTWQQAHAVKDRFPDFVVAIGDNRVRLEAQHRLHASGFQPMTIIHPAACVSDSARIGAGSVIFAGAIVNPDARIGLATIINTGATVDHDCFLADGVHVSPGVHMAGGVSVGECAWLGIGAVVIGGVHIGAHAVVGAGAAVLADVGAGETAVGVPARAANPPGGRA